MSIINALQTLQDSLGNAPAVDAAIEALAKQRSLVATAEHYMTQACCQATAGHTDLARRSLDIAKGLLTAVNLP